MRIEKNVSDTFFNTMIDIKGKSKDNVKARMDLKEYYKRIQLELVKVSNGRIYKHKGKFSLIIEPKRTVCEWVKKFKNAK